MSLSQRRSLKKVSGARYKPQSKVLADLGSLPTNTLVAAKSKKKVKRERGGGKKDTLLTAAKVNVFDPKTKKSSLADVTKVLENDANRNFIRRNIITKGAVIETSVGKAKVTSRPGQEGTLNAVLVE